MLTRQWLARRASPPRFRRMPKRQPSSPRSNRGFEKTPSSFGLRTWNISSRILRRSCEPVCRQDWASRPDWKQDAEGFVLSRLVAEWVKQTNYLYPERLVTLRKSLDDYRRLQRQCALREWKSRKRNLCCAQDGAGQLFGSRRLLGLPIALYGLLNHLVIGLALFLAGSFKRNSSRARTTEWTIRIAVTLGLYILQIFLVAHWWGRAAAGYYAPTLPVSGAYLWRYVRLVRPQARLMFISLSIPALTRKIKRLRHELLEELDQMLRSYEERVSVPR